MGTRRHKRQHRIIPGPDSKLVDANLLTYRQASTKLGVNVRTLKYWVSAGKVDVVRFGPHCVRFTLAALDRLTADHTTEAR